MKTTTTNASPAFSFGFLTLSVLFALNVFAIQPTPTMDITMAAVTLASAG